MNKIYSIVWSEAHQDWIVAHESASRHGKPSTTRRAVSAALITGLLTANAYAAPPAANALPTGGNVVAGQAGISQSGNTLNINQTTSKAAINWNTFSIGSDATVNIIQPGKSSVLLNRVIGSDPSYIYGRLNANGQVFLLNPNGILFGKGAKVDVGGLVATTLKLKDSDFLSGNYHFFGNGGSVVNQGELLGNYIALLAPEVRNEGIMAARQGTVALAGGTGITLNLVNNQLIDVMVDTADINTLVENKHLIQAADGTVILAARSANHLLGKVVNSGTIEANGISTDGGKVRLTASSNIEHSGSINVDAGTNGKGGSAILIANLDNPNSRTDISGSISARGGSESGDGGFVETSGTHLKIADSARVNTTADHGKVGNWLLDPYDFTIAKANGDITGAALSSALALSNVTIQTADTAATCTNTTCGSGNSSGNGDIFVNDTITWGSNKTLTLSAWRNIGINAPITISGTGSLALEFAQSDIAANFPAGIYNVNAPVSLAAGAGFSTKAGSDGAETNYTVINDATALANIASGLAGNYVLGSDVAAPVSSWSPLGNTATPFTGIFDGLGHKITGLQHTNSGSDTDVGLFGGSTGLIQNVGVTGVNIDGSQNVGALVGYNNGFVVNSYATGTVTGSGVGNVGRIGGLVGFSMGPIMGSYADVTVSATTGDQGGAPMTDPMSSGKGGIGGLAGVVGTSVADSYARGSVTGVNAVGGLVGFSGAGINNSYSTGAVSGTTNVGGFVGQVPYTDPMFFIFKSFWDTQTSGQMSGGGSLSDGLTGLNTAGMKTTSNFTSGPVPWDTSSVWELRSGQYPLLKAMLQPIFVYADNKSSTYNGAAFSSFTSTVAAGNATAGVNYNGAVVVTPSTPSPTNAATYTLTTSGLSLANAGDQNGYRIQDEGGTLIIGKATAKLVATKTYNGDKNFTSSQITVTGVGAETLTLSGSGPATAFSQNVADSGINYLDSLGGYTLANGTNGGLAANYLLPSLTGRSADNQVDITAVTLHLVDLTGSKVYDGSPTFSYTQLAISPSSIIGSDSVNLASGSASVSSANKGHYTLFEPGSTLALGGGSASNYTLTGGGVSVDIIARPVNVTVDAGQHKTYGDNNPGSYTYTAEAQSTGRGLLTAEMLTGVLTRVGGEDATTYAIQQNTLTNGNNPNYAITYTGNNFTINKRDITVVADAVSKTYGDNDPTLSVQRTAGSLANNAGIGVVDSLADVTGTITRQTGENVANGPYDIQLGTGTKAANYNITFNSNNNALTINKRDITVVADAATKIYGQADPTLSVQRTAGSLANNAGIGVVDSLADVTGTITRQAGENVADGPRDIQLGTGTKASNYNITFNSDNNALAITKADLSTTYVGTKTDDGIDTIAGSLIKANGVTVNGVTEYFNFTGTGLLPDTLVNISTKATDKVASIGDLALDSANGKNGALAGNYNLPVSIAATDFDITVEPQANLTAVDIIKRTLEGNLEKAKRGTDTTTTDFWKKINDKKGVTQDDRDTVTQSVKKVLQKLCGNNCEVDEDEVAKYLGGVTGCSAGLVLSGGSCTPEQKQAKVEVKKTVESNSSPSATGVPSEPPKERTISDTNRDIKSVVQYFTDAGEDNARMAKYVNRANNVGGAGDTLTTNEDVDWVTSYVQSKGQNVTRDQVKEWLTGGKGLVEDNLGKALAQLKATPTAAQAAKKKAQDVQLDAINTLQTALENQYNTNQALKNAKEEQESLPRNIEIYESLISTSVNEISYYKEALKELQAKVPPDAASIEYYSKKLDESQKDMSARIVALDKAKARVIELERTIPEMEKNLTSFEKSLTDAQTALTDANKKLKDASDGVSKDDPELIKKNAREEKIQSLISRNAGAKDLSDAEITSLTTEMNQLLKEGGGNESITESNLKAWLATESKTKAQDRKVQLKSEWDDIKKQLTDAAAKKADPAKAVMSGNLDWFVVADLKDQGWTAQDFKDAGIDIAQLYVPEDVAQSASVSTTHYSKTTADTTNSNFSLNAKLAFSKEELIAAGYDVNTYAAKDKKKEKPTGQVEEKKTAGAVVDAVGTTYHK